MKISFLTIGCKLNQAETRQLALDFQKMGFPVTERLEVADIFIINTCAVTESATRKSRQTIHKIKNKFPKSFIVATGCSIEQKDNVDLFISNKENLVRQAVDFLAQKGLWPEKDHKLLKPPALHRSFNDKIRGFVKVQDGCDNFCTYCLISKRRGKVRGESPRQIIASIKRLEKENFQEVILSGVNLNKYFYRQRNEILKLRELLQIILKETKIERIRLGSLDPSLIDDKFIALWKKNLRLCPHWHLSLQSGSNRILQSMGRKYNREEYLSIVQKLRKINPFFSFTTDIIVGFPGETEKDFKDTSSLVKKVEFLKVHVFPFSPRPGTKAFHFKEKITLKEKSARSRILVRQAKEVAAGFVKKMIGREAKVLFEGKRKGFFEGYTENFHRIFQKSQRDLRNRVVKVVLKEE